MDTLVVDLLTTLAQLLMGGYFFGNFCKVKRFRLFVLLFAATGLLNYYLTGYAFPQFYRYRGYTAIGIQVILTFSMRGVSILRCTVWYTLSTLFMFLSELPSTMVVLYLYPDFVNTASVPASLLLLWKLLYLPVMLICFLIPYRLLSRFYEPEKDTTLLRLTPVVVIQMLLFLVPTMLSMLDYADFLHYGPLLIAYLLLDVLFFVLLIRTLNRSNRVYELEQREKRSEAMTKAQLAYYQHLQDSTAALRKIRHDLRNQLTTLSILLDRGDNETAVRQLRAIHENMVRADHQSVTGDPVIDAVIDSKAAVCQDAGISLRASGQLQSTSLEPMELCSITDSMLSQAIASCNALPPEKHPEVTFSVEGDEHAVIFRCDFSAENQEDANSFNLQFLQRAAAEHGGALELSGDAGHTRLTLSLFPAGAVSASPENPAISTHIL